MSKLIVDHLVNSGSVVGESNENELHDEDDGSTDGVNDDTKPVELGKISTRHQDEETNDSPRHI